MRLLTWILTLSQKSPLGRYSCIAQGASPGLGIDNHLLSLKGAALPKRKANARVIVPLLRSSIRFYLCVPRVLFVPLALSPPWALQECRPKGLTHPHVMYKLKRICAWSVEGRVIVGLDCGRWAFVGSDMLVHGNGLGLGIINRKSPARAALLHSPGRKPWVICYQFIY